MTQTWSAETAGRVTPAAPKAVQRYSPFAVLLHWTMAGLIIFSGILGLLLDQWPKDSKLTWINIHAQVGLLVLVLLIARVWWRKTHAPPSLPEEVSELSRRVSHPAHLLLYILMLITPLVGIVAFVWHGRVLDFGLFSLDLRVPVNAPVFHRAEDIHLWLTYGLFTLVSGHAIAALWHHFVSCDPVLLRMLPGESSFAALHRTGRS
jgi:cytochrome b561